MGRKGIIMEDLLYIDDRYYLETISKYLLLNYDTNSFCDCCEITKEKAKDIIEFLTKFLEEK